MTFFHVTAAVNKPSIQKNGLLPMIGYRSRRAEEPEPRIYLFPDFNTMMDGVANWLYDAICDEYHSDDCELIILKVNIPDNSPIIITQTDFEYCSQTAIPPEYITFFPDTASNLLPDGDIT